MAVRLPVSPDEDLDAILSRLKSYHSQDVLLVLPAETRALQDLNSFTALRNTVRAENINLTIAGGNKTIRALANLLGFAVEKPPSPASVVPAGSGTVGTVVRPDYSGVADGFVAASPDQKFTRPESDYAVNVPPATPPPAQTSPQPAQPTNFAGNLQPPQPGINLSGQSAIPGSEDRTRNGFFAAPEPIPTGFIYPASDPESGSQPEEYEPLPGFLDELVEDDNAAGQFRTRQGQPVPRPPAGAFFSRKNRVVSTGEAGASGPEDNAWDNYEIEEVPDPDADPEDEAAAVSAANFARSRSAGGAQARPTRLRPVAGAVSGPAVTAKGGLASLYGDRRTTWTLALAVLFAILLVIVLFLLLVKPGGVLTLGPQVQTLTVPLKTELVTNTVRLELVPSSGGAAPTGATNATVPAGTNSLPSGPSGTPGATPAATQIPPATLPVELINTGEIKKSGTLPATGIRKVPDQPAGGPVIFYNRSFSPKSYGAGTVIYTRNGVTYRLVRAITIPGSTQFNGQAGQATGEVVADKAGTVGNVAELVSFPLNENVGVGLGPLTSGTDKNEKFVTQADLDALKKQLQDQARAEVNTALKYDQTTQGVFIIKTTEPACTFPQKVNDTADTVSGSCTTSLEAARYRTADAVANAATHFVTDPALQMDSQMPLEFVGTPKLVQDQGRNFMEIGVRGRVIHTLDPAAFKTAVAGKTKADAATLIATDFPQVDTAQLDLRSITGDPLPTPDLLQIKTILDYEVAVAAQTPGATTGGTLAPTATPKS